MHVTLDEGCTSSFIIQAARIISFESPPCDSVSSRATNTAVGTIRNEVVNAVTDNRGVVLTQAKCRTISHRC